MLPWRGIDDPYKIWISEIILQQTRVAQGLGYYERFIGRFPTVRALAEAEEDEVMQMWQGLGYYSRARNLHAAAKQIGEGEFPSEYKEIRALKGVGDYTAAAIASFAYGQRVATVDGNVYRVLSRYLGVDTPIDSTQGKRWFAEVAQELLDKNRPAAYNQALMDFGALQCVPKGADCGVCPMSDSCWAYREDKVGELPVKAKKVKMKTRFLVYVYLRRGKEIWLHRRGEGDIWQGLYEPLLVEGEKRMNWQEVKDRLALKGEMTVRQVMENFKHVLTHRVLMVDAYVVELEGGTEENVRLNGGMWVKEEDRGDYAVPRVVELLYKQL